MTDRSAPRLLAPRVDVEPREDGSIVLRSPEPLGDHPPHLGHHLRRWAARAPERIFLAERDGAGGWRRVTYREAETAAASIAQALLDRGLSASRPVAILSGNAIDHALLTLGAMQAGVPVAPISVAYSLLSHDHARLRALVRLLAPGMIYVADAGPFGAALDAIAPEMSEATLVTTGDPGERAATRFADLLATAPGAAAAEAFDRVGPDTVAKVLFTSGSTGTPKGVINTQRMLCSNQQAIAQAWPFLEDRPPVLVDWLPWSHTFGANHNVNLVLRNGGTLHISDGKPMPDLIERTVACLREVSPTIYFDVPRGFDVLLPFLEADAGLRDRFFAELDAVFYAGAALPQNLWERLEALALAARGERVLMLSAWGSTETAPMATTVHYPIDRAGNIGLPAPGIEVKLAPADGERRELRVRGPNVTPGYWGEPPGGGAFAERLDAEGFLAMGDAGRLADPDDPAAGLVFAGRTAENFKLTTGSWVSVGALRVAIVAACEPVVQDAVIAGHDRDEIGVLLFASLAGCRALCPEAGADATLGDLIARPAVRQRVRQGLAAHATTSPGASTLVARALLMTEPPSIDAGEITDKGYVNQHAVLERRADLVARLYDDEDPDVIRVAPTGESRSNRLH